MSKLYYDCPNEAMAMLALHPELKLAMGTGECDLYTHKNAWMVTQDYKYRTANNFKDWNGRIYIHADSEHIFQPHDGDIGVDKDGSLCIYCWSGDFFEWLGFETGIDDESVKTIYRNNKAFIMPKVEKDDANKKQ